MEPLTQHPPRSPGQALPGQAQPSEPGDLAVVHKVVAVAIAVAALVLVVAYSDRSWWQRLVIDLPAVAAAGIAGAALWRLFRPPAVNPRSRSAEQTRDAEQTRAEQALQPAQSPQAGGSNYLDLAAHDRLPVAVEPSGHPVPGPPGAPAPAPVAPGGADGSQPEAPRDSPLLGRPSKAQQAPWRLLPRSAQSGVAADEGLVGDLAVRAASIIGPNHRCQAPVVPRQDAYRVATDDASGHLVVAVADGVGNARFAELGANAAVSAAVRFCCDQLRPAAGGSPGISPGRANLALPEAVLRACFATAAKDMARTAASRRLQHHDVASVLMTVVVPALPASDNMRWAAVAWVGDLSAWVVRDGQWSHRAGDRKTPDGGILSHAVANALPDGAGGVRITAVDLEPGDLLVVATDGVGDAVEGLPELRAEFARRWSAPPAVARFVADIGFEAPQCDDDRTCVAVWVAHLGQGRP